MHHGDGIIRQEDQHGGCPHEYDVRRRFGQQIKATAHSKHEETVDMWKKVFEKPHDAMQPSRAHCTRERIRLNRAVSLVQIETHYTSVGSVMSHDVKGEGHVVVYHSHKMAGPNVADQFNSDESEEEEILLLSHAAKSTYKLNLPLFFSGRSLVNHAGLRLGNPTVRPI